MQVDRYKHFKWTPRTAWLSIIFAVVIPSSLYYVANKTDVSRLFPYLWTAGNACQELEVFEGEVEQEEPRRGPSMGLRLEAAKTAHDRSDHTTTHLLSKMSCERWHGEDTTAQGAHHQAPERRLNTCKPTLEMMETNSISYRASTSSAAREEVTP